MKKTLLVALAIILALCLVACTSKTEAPAAEAPAEQPATEAPAATEAGGGDITIVIMPKLIGIPYFNATETGAYRAGEALGVNVIYAGPTEADATQQVKMLEDFIAQGVDAIAVAPNDPAGLTPTLKKAADAGIKVIDWDTAAERDYVQYSVAQVDITEEATHTWGTMAKELGGNGYYAVLTGGPEAANLNARIEVGEAFMRKEFPDMKLVTDIIPTNESQQEAYSKTLDLMKAYPEIQGIICQSSPTIPGAGQAIQELGLGEETFLIGHGMPNVSRPYLKDGSADVVTLWDVEALGYLAIYVAWCAVTGTPVTDGMPVDTVGNIRLEADGKGIIMGPPLDITAANVDNYDY